MSSHSRSPALGVSGRIAAYFQRAQITPNHSQPDRLALLHLHLPTLNACGTATAPSLFGFTGIAEQLLLSRFAEQIATKFDTPAPGPADPDDQ